MNFNLSSAIDRPQAAKACVGALLVTLLFAKIGRASCRERV